MSSRKSSARRRKRVRRRPRRLPRRSSIKRPIRMFPKTALVELTYCDQVLVNTRNMSSGHPYLFRLNSLFDPDYTSTGHQPRGFDQWKTMYNKYCVIGAKVLIEPLQCVGTTSTESFTLFSFIDDDVTTETYTVEQLRELRMPGNRARYITVQDDKNVPTTLNKRITHKVSMKKFFGLSKKTQMFKPSGIGQGDHDETTSVGAADLYAAETDSNPTRNCYLKISAQGVSDSGFQVQCRVTIRYMAVLYDPQEIGAS
jgi:hypothetical protein